MKRCTTVIEWLTHAYEDFQYNGNFNESAKRQPLKALYGIVRQSSKWQFTIIL